MKTARTLIDVEQGKLTVRSGDESMTFDMFDSPNYPDDHAYCFSFDVLDNSSGDNKEEVPIVGYGGTPQVRRRMTQEAEEEAFELQCLFDEESPQEEQEVPQESIVEPSKDIEKVNHDNNRAGSVREPVVDAKTWAPHLSQLYDDSCFGNHFDEFMHVEDLSPPVEKFLDEPILKPLLRERFNFEDISVPKNCRCAFIDNDLSMPIFISNSLSFEHERYLLVKLEEKMHELKEVGPILVLPVEESMLEELSCTRPPMDEKGNELMEPHDHFDSIFPLFSPYYSSVICNFKLSKGKCYLTLANLGASRHKYYHLPYEDQNYVNFDSQMFGDSSKGECRLTLENFGASRHKLYHSPYEEKRLREL